MRLSRLELFGFKSFLNRTVFQFSEGVTSIVGPNGCGKSNVVDAIVWGLGERGTKSLRVKDMGDVIFHGTGNKRPVNIAEVAIEFLDGETETAIKRRIYRDGVIEYFLNGSPVRLKDIQDFFLGTGIGMNSYAIIEQGKIEYFIQMKPQERKVVVEETSGVTRFEEKKREAAVRLAEVGANLERVEDIYREVVKAFEKGEQEWERWKEYRRLSDLLSEVDKWILIDGRAKLAKRIGKVEERAADVRREASRNEEEAAGLRTEQEAKEKEYALVDKAIRQLEIDIKGQEKDMESRLLEIEYLREEEERLAKERARLLKEQTDLEGRREALSREAEELASRKAEEEALLGRAEEDEVRVRDALQGLKAGLAGCEKQMEEKRVALFVSMSRVTEIKNRVAEMERIEGDRKRREESRQAECMRLGEKLRGLDGNAAASRAALDKARTDLADLASEEQSAIQEKEKNLARLQAKRSGIEQLKGAKRGKEEFIRQMRSLQGIKEENPLNRSKLVDVVRVEEGAEKALERFFFKEMEYYVLTEEGAAAIAETVGKHEGNFIFFPPRGIFRRNASDIAIKVKWIDTVEAALQRIEGGEEGIFINHTACIDSRGFILREREGKKVDLKSYRDRVKAEKEMKEISAALEAESSALKDDEAAHARSEARARSARTAREEKERRVNGLERERVAIETELRTVRERLRELETRADFAQEAEAPTREGLLAEKAVHEQEKGKIEAAIAAVKQEAESAKRIHDETLSAWHQATLDIERKRNRIKTLGSDMERRAALRDNLRKEGAGNLERLRETGERILDRTGKAAGLEKSYGDLKEALERQVTRYEALKKDMGTLHMERRGLEEKGEAISKEAGRLRGRIEAIEKETLILMEKKGVVEERLKEIYGIEDPAGMTVPQGVDFEAERDKIGQDIADAGEVNFRAEKEYLELKERVAFLETQKEDLKNAADSLRKTIAKIDNITKEIFFETFETVNGAFKRFTGTLFKGGKGYLSYNPETAGIDMFVQPPGKKVARMEQLSGGEKALISLSFLLSLIDTKPSPFVLMDEIDAPLDDANLMSLMEIVRDMSQKTQIVFITHNRITMEYSHTIYGVTMEEEGISKTISVRL